MSRATSRTSDTAPPSRGTESPAFLLAQLGAHAASRFAERLSVLDLAPPHAGILRFVSASGGISQQALAGHLRILPSRLVIGAYLFGAVTILQLHAQGWGVGVPSQLMSAMPYLATVIVLVLISRARTGGSTAPAALGTVFVPDR